MGERGEMGMKKNYLWGLLIACLLWAPEATGAAQVYVESTNRQGEKVVEVLFIQDGKVRYGQGDSTSGTYAVFVLELETLFVVMPQEQRYFEMNEDIARRRQVDVRILSQGRYDRLWGNVERWE